MSPENASELNASAVLKTPAAAVYTGLSASTLNKLRCTGGGPRFILLTARSVGYLRADLDAYLASRRRQSTSDHGPSLGVEAGAVAIKRAKPAPAATGNGLRIERFGRLLNSSHTPNPGSEQTAARLAVGEMMSNGARFTITRRADGAAHWLYELAPGGDRTRCRRIIKDAKARGGAYWDAFHQAIVEIAEGGAQ